ncbi:MAG TPA: hypothetical protein VFY13_02060 [Luteolibacter sp.]|nr:hypothetical protein [Luteolibacter sp.]
MLKSVCSARAGFTQADIRFIESLHDPDSGGAIRSLAADPEALQAMLDLVEVRRALLESPVALPVSPSLYFFVLVRHALLEGGVDHLRLTDHIAGVLVDKLAWASRGSGGLPTWTTHAVDFIALIREASGLLKVHLEVAAGDQFLVLTGLFPSFIDQRRERCGAPGIDFYESFGRRSYQMASSHQALGPESRELFGLLAEVFPIARRSLNKMRESCLFLGD